MKINWNYKIIYKIKHKITYIQRNLVASFHQQNARKNTPGRVTFQAKIQVDDLHLYLKIHSPYTPSSHPPSKNQPIAFWTNAALELIEMP